MTKLTRNSNVSIPFYTDTSCIKCMICEKVCLVKLKLRMEIIYGINLYSAIIVMLVLIFAQHSQFYLKKSIY
ncbi:hypothetical protein Bccel_1272 [Pseudobacteroides cellulosolvens ATCC 35603 = DSM 2933]|uniref:Uncharacterized protein n=1 Tax=Pseudobacteroides cellulosolvens ATCC 35603 = DSM 2933 TaxID=398512 RepID=A0A0L6JJT9_9FIRM|nr:hypothetical protein Bccel_1272 [Pseudobacteroides cellulosolvens ATCC 35603 = DSM 2933]